MFSFSLETYPCFCISSSLLKLSLFPATLFANTACMCTSKGQSYHLFTSLCQHYPVTLSSCHLAALQLLFGPALTSHFHFVSFPLMIPIYSFLRVTAVNYFFHSALPPGDFTLHFVCHNVAQLSCCVKTFLMFSAILSSFDMLQ